jgi:hypothetical protein
MHYRLNKITVYLIHQNKLVHLSAVVGVAVLKYLYKAVPLFMIQPSALISSILYAALYMLTPCHCV